MKTTFLIIGTFLVFMTNISGQNVGSIGRDPDFFNAAVAL
jgi:hypothetical protein